MYDAKENELKVAIIDILYKINVSYDNVKIMGQCERGTRYDEPTDNHYLNLQLLLALQRVIASFSSLLSCPDHNSLFCNKRVRHFPQELVETTNRAKRE